jgi:hypothetical protein
MIRSRSLPEVSALSRVLFALISPHTLTLLALFSLHLMCHLYQKAPREEAILLPSTAQRQPFICRKVLSTSSKSLYLISFLPLCFSLLMFKDPDLLACFVISCPSSQ